MMEVGEHSPILEGSPPPSLREQLPTGFLGNGQSLRYGALTPQCEEGGGESSLDIKHPLPPC